MLQHFNMVKIESRPQTMKISVIGSENYSGTLSCGSCVRIAEESLN